MNGGTYLTGLITGIGKALKNNQATAMLIKNCFAFTEFSKHHKNQIHFNFLMKARVGPMSVWGGGGVGGWGLGSGGFLSDVFFFQIGGPITAGLISGRGAYIVLGGGGGIFGYIFFLRRWVYNCGAYKWEGGLYWGQGGYYRMKFFIQVGGPITLGL